MTIGRAIVLAISLFALAGTAIAAPEFMTYESRNPVRDGQGGERKSVDGIDFWMRGDPPKKYQILGSLTDERHKTGLFGAIRMASLESDIAKAAKAAGGDAVILVVEGDEAIGVVGSSFGNTSGSFNDNSFNANNSSVRFGHMMKNHESRYFVIKYLPDIPSTPTAAFP